MKNQASAQAREAAETAQAQVVAESSELIREKTRVDALDDEDEREVATQNLERRAQVVAATGALARTKAAAASHAEAMAAAHSTMDNAMAAVPSNPQLVASAKADVSKVEANLYASQSDVAVAEQHVQAALLVEAHAEVQAMAQQAMSPPVGLTDRIAQQEVLLEHAGAVAEARVNLAAVAKIKARIQREQARIATLPEGEEKRAQQGALEQNPENEQARISKTSSRCFPLFVLVWCDVEARLRGSSREIPCCWQAEHAFAEKVVEVQKLEQRLEHFIASDDIGRFRPLSIAPKHVHKPSAATEKAADKASKAAAAAETAERVIEKEGVKWEKEAERVAQMKPSKTKAYSSSAHTPSWMPLESPVFNAVPLTDASGEGREAASACDQSEPPDDAVGESQGPSGCGPPSASAGKPSL